MVYCGSVDIVNSSVTVTLGTIDLMVTMMVILHTVLGHHRFPNVHVKLNNTNMDAGTPPGWTTDLVMTSKPISISLLVTMSSPVLHHFTNTDAHTLSWRCYRLSNDQIDTFVAVFKVFAIRTHTHTHFLSGFMCVCACVCAYACVCVCTCACMCVRTCV